MPGGDRTGPNGSGPRAGRGRGRGQQRGRGLSGGFAQGPGGECRCPNCGYRESHQLAAPCYTKKCPKCGNSMTRA